MAPRPQPDNRDRHLVAQQGAFVHRPIELVHISHVESRLIYSFAADNRMTVLEDEAGELAVRYAQRGSRRIKMFAQLGNDLLRDRTVARRGNDPLPSSKMADD